MVNPAHSQILLHDFTVLTERFGKSHTNMTIKLNNHCFKGHNDLKVIISTTNDYLFQKSSPNFTSKI